MSVAVSDLKKILLSNYKWNSRGVSAKKPMIWKNECAKMSSWPSLDAVMNFELKSNNNYKRVMLNAFQNANHVYEKSMISLSRRQSMIFPVHSSLMLKQNLMFEWMRNSAVTATLVKPKFKTVSLVSDMNAK